MASGARPAGVVPLWWCAAGYGTPPAGHRRAEAFAAIPRTSDPIEVFDGGRFAGSTELQAAGGLA
jgi:hypothetical protein